MSVQKKESDYWDIDEADNNVKGIEYLTVNKIGKLTPAQIARTNNNNVLQIIEQTEVLFDFLKRNNQVIQEIRKIRDYVPECTNEKQTELWKHKIIPLIIKSIEQNGNVKTIISTSIDAVRDLSIVIKNMSEIITELEGEPVSIKIAQKKIPGALAVLNISIYEIQNIDNILNKGLYKNSKDLAEIIGSEAGNYVKIRAEMNKNLDEHTKKKNALLEEILKKEEELLEILNTMLKYGKNLRISSKEIEKINKEIKLKTEKHLESMNEYKKFQNSGVINPNDKSAIDFDHTLKSLAKNIDKKNKIKLSKETMEKKMAELTRKKVTTENQLNDMDNFIPEKIRLEEKRIEEIKSKIETQIIAERQTMHKIGLQGQVLLECLILIENMNQHLNLSDKPYSNFISIMNSISNFINSDLPFLQSKEKNIVNFACNHLMQKAEFLSSYANVAMKQLISSFEN